MRRHGFIGLLTLAVLSCLSPRARADGAFPDAQNLLTPVAWPDEFILATTFGVVFSVDGGRTWLWTCEQERNLLGIMYQVSLPPRHRIYALANETVVFSDDMTCSWRLATGAVSGQKIFDLWVDRAVPDRLFAIGARCCEANGAVHSVFPSRDGGQTFGAAVYAGAAGDVVTGVETSVSDPGVVYLTIEVGGRQPTLVRSADGGTTWAPRDLSLLLGSGRFRLVDVDPEDPDRVFLLWRDVVRGEQLVLTEDGGKTVAVVFPGDGGGRVLNAFARTPSGALVLATDTNGVGGLLRSTDRGHTFVEVPNPPHLRGFSVRGDVLFGGTDNFADGYAIGASTDDGTTWRPVMRYDQVQAVPSCLQASCRTDCEALAPLLWPPAICGADALLPDAGAGGAGGLGGESAVGAGGRAPRARGGGGGCGCTVTSRTGDVASRWGALVLIAVGRRALRRRRLHP